jgi:hypothetical protein
MRITAVLVAIASGASLAAACGGSTNDGAGGGPDGSTATSSGSGSSSGSDDTSSSSSSSGGALATGDDATAPACTDTADCGRGRVCCATIAVGGATGFGLSVACAATCPSGLAFQLCASSLECPTGEDCTPSPLGTGSYCAAPGGISTRFDAGGLSTRDSGAPLDATAPTVDAATGLDGSPSIAVDASADAAADAGTDGAATDDADEGADE